MILRFFFPFFIVLLRKAVAHNAGQKEQLHGVVNSKINSPHSEELHHKAVLGSSKLAHEFDEMSPDDSKRRLKILAFRMDADNDGFVTTEELSAWVESSLILLDEEETKERFLEIDADRNGKVTWEEYLREAFDILLDKDVLQQISDPEDRKLVEEDRKYFKAADSDNNNQLSHKEFLAFQNPEHFQQMHSTLIETTLTEKDTNKDGKIDLKEFLGDTFEQPNSEWFATEKDRFVNEYDVDKNGFLEGDEFKAWLIPNIKKTATQEAEHLLAAADNDKDGKLTIDEIVNAYKTFVGSEATSFGERLLDVSHEEL